MNDVNLNKQEIQNGKAILGIELGSTRIKSVLIRRDHTPLAFGVSEWENRFKNGMWTYALDDVRTGMQQSFGALRDEVKSIYGDSLTAVSAIGISAMMHGYLVFDDNGELLTPFRTWRNTNTEEAAKQLTELFQFNIPQRWSIAHLHQSILNKEAHVKDISYITTLAGYVHRMLTGEKVLGIGDASGMFPIDSETNNYDTLMVNKYDSIIEESQCAWTLGNILPKVLVAGEQAGVLTRQGAKLLDPSGQLNPGIPFCPPEGDAGTGMTATNSVAPNTGNISAGTSTFAMIVLDKGLSHVYPEIDMVTTPTGNPVAMIHCNNCTSDMDAWIKIFMEVNNLFGNNIDKDTFYKVLYEKAIDSDSDCGGLLSYNYYSGEPITGFVEGRPLLCRMPDSNFTLDNLIRCLLYSAMGTLRIGMDILSEDEHVQVDTLFGHGGFFKVKGVAQRLMAAALKTPVSVMETAGEGGAWGMAILAAYMLCRNSSETLDSYLARHVFSQNESICVEPVEADVNGFDAYMKRYKEGLAIERAAVKFFR